MFHELADRRKSIRFNQCNIALEIPFRISQELERQAFSGTLSGTVNNLAEWLVFLFNPKHIELLSFSLLEY